jgi:hypothetical protein
MYLSKIDSTMINTYAQWPLSPIPHAAEATWWMIFVASLWVFNFVLFFTLGKKKKGARDATVQAPSSERELTAEERKTLESAPAETKKTAEGEKP